MSSESTPTREGSDPFTDDPERTQKNNSTTTSTTASNASSVKGATAGARQRGPQQLRFGTGEALDPMGNKTAFNLRDSTSGESSRPTITTTPAPISDVPSYFTSPPSPVTNPGGTPVSSQFPNIPRISLPPRAYSGATNYKKPAVDDDEEMNEKYDSFFGNDEMSQEERMAKLGSYSAPNSAPSSPTLGSFSVGQGGRNTVSIDVPILDIGSAAAAALDDLSGSDKEKPKVTATREARDLVRQHTRRYGIPPGGFGQRHHSTLSEATTLNEQPSGFNTPMVTQHADYVEEPMQYRGGVLGTLLTLYNNPNNGPEPGRSTHKQQASVSTMGTSNSGPVSGRSTPKWYNKSANTSTTSLGGLLAASNSGQGIAGSILSGKGGRPKMKRNHSSGIVDKLKNSLARPNLDQEIRITVHIAETLQRQRYIIKICKALMLYGAPTHRMEEALKMTSRVLEIDAQFLYLPNCMIISFGDQTTHTSEMQIVRTNQGLDLGKLMDVHQVYKSVVHDCMSVEVAAQELDDIISRKPKYKPWMVVLIYGFASATVGPFGFKARLQDMPILFLLGCILGFLQHVVAPRSELYSNIFEISAAIITSFLARAFGSIRGGSLFCFSALAQASIALILPGYIILCGSLELQSKNLVAGSVRMFYAIIYSLFLGFGITIGSALYGLMDSNATSLTSCQAGPDPNWNFLFVPLFTVCLLAANHAKWRQAPLMVAISMAGYVVNFFVGHRFGGQPQVANGLGALTIGILGNVYARVGHGVAFAAMLPGIFVQVPSGLAAQGSLLSGLESANALVQNKTTISASSPLGANSIMFEFGLSMIQVAVGITVGLFSATLIVYPFGKKRSGLFSF
ncbi:hypothetical protein FPQ18DRAFT_31596 [Pyronema domesticum]|uniref:Similar to Uncharacterized UPF0442 protein C7D4.12c acc. no. O14267 n=1 Tax=Pyronema omphalodes (strain CBS 100304) TaxID=1076935 RepID=U4LPI6_PYROM|nr:hypothetical protein FPQ18DRAFT_31596 [Pyronema domesticum]CCX33845.1 Similar to Uncharacterized UPF0442 protein C7D4.12c; acc. no. O14267 [Pyronema omphalodes CBS 100304]